MKPKIDRRILCDQKDQKQYFIAFQWSMRNAAAATAVPVMSYDIL